MEKVKSATEQILKDGYTIIKNCVNNDYISILYNAMLPTTYELLEKKEWGGFGKVKGHLQQFPPRYKQYLFKNIICNELAVEVAYNILGDSIYCNFYSSNTNCPGSLKQQVHPDWTPLWPKYDIVHPPASLVINIPLNDISKRNGSTKIWPKSHLLPCKKRIISEQDIKDSGLEETRLNCSKGDIIIRDPRMWHCGMPNKSNHPRIMLALIYNISWLQRDEPQVYDIHAKPILLNSKIEFNATFSDKNIDHSVDPTKDRYQVD